ncbi:MULTISPECIES: hypothetical protein [unclassified Paludibacterium]|uniref:hypothetical protein n=1 Tax=unclassified Paludibacterium TaxID=2618429 RepID=UPI001C05BE17|nr:hypothetical protein [Paludibacterium sp. B53371]BEV72908.1 hypothetical protein THUN1379_23900 [Paludibacterium sp. THUN1379]
MKPEDLINNLHSLNGPALWSTLAILLIALCANLLYYRTLQRTMRVIDPSRRPFPPITVWASLLPLVGILWFMVYIIMLSLGLQKELRARNLPGNGAFGVTMGTVTLFLLFLVPGYQLYVVFPAMILWAIHWHRMAMYRKLLADPVYLLVD